MFITKGTKFIVAWRENRDRQETAKIYLFLTLIYLGRFSALLSKTTFTGRFWFIFVSVSASVFVNGHKNLDFRRLYSPNFQIQTYSCRNCHFRRLFITAPRTSFILYLTDPFSRQNQPIKELVKKSQQRVKSCLSYHWLYSLILLLMIYQLNFEFIYSEFYTYLRQLLGTYLLCNTMTINDSLHTFQISINVGSPSDAVYYHTEDIPFWRGM